jgi:hypothetical protein
MTMFRSDLPISEFSLAFNNPQFVHALAAKSLIRELEAIGLNSRRGEAEWIPEYKKTVEELGIKYKLASSRTSFIAVDKATLSELEGPGYEDVKIADEVKASAVRIREMCLSLDRVKFKAESERQENLQDSIFLSCHSIEAAKALDQSNCINVLASASQLAEQGHVELEISSDPVEHMSAILRRRKEKKIILILVILIVVPALFVIIYYSLRK